MARRDVSLCAAFFLVLLIPFARLLLNPALIPGNFGDIYLYHYPLRHLATATLQEGRLPLWDPYIFAGVPLAANPQAALFYPVSAVHHLFPLAWSLSLEMFLHIFSAWLGAYLLLRKWGLDRAGCWTLAFAYGFSPFLVCRIPQGIPTHLAVLAWIPWIWLCAQSPSRVLWGLALALQILSGHPQFALINLLALGLWALCRRPRLVLRFAAGGLLALALDWVQAGPTLQFLGRSVRMLWNPAFSLGYSLKPFYLLTFLYPDVLGNPSRPGFLLYPSEYFEMLTAYIGLIPLLLAAPGLRRVRALWALPAAGLFFALGQNNPLYIPMQKTLGLDFLRVPSRFSIVILWALWLASAAGWKGLCSRRPPAVKLLLMAITGLDLLFWSGRWIAPQRAAEFLAPNPRVLGAIRDPRYRFATSPDISSADKALLYRIPNATGYEAFYPWPIAIFTSRSEGEAAADASRTYIRKWRTPAMSRLSVRYYLSPEPIPGQTPKVREGSTFVYENRSALPLVQGAKTWRLPSAERYEAWSDEPGAVVFSQADYPGWKAWVNGVRAPVSDDHGLFPSVALQGKGPWTVHFVFQPGWWLFGLLVSLISLALVLWSAMRRWARWRF